MTTYPQIYSMVYTRVIIGHLFYTSYIDWFIKKLLKKRLKKLLT